MSARYYTVDGEVHKKLKQAFGWKLIPTYVFEQFLATTNNRKMVQITLVR